MAEYVTLMSSSNLPELKPFVRSMVGLGIVISFLVILLNMHTMVMERTREVGILKALGFSRFDVVKMLLGETLVLTLLGAGFGILITFLTEAVLKEVNPGLTILITPTVGVVGDRAGGGRFGAGRGVSGAARGELRSGCRAGLRIIHGSSNHNEPGTKRQTGR